MARPAGIVRQFAWHACVVLVGLGGAGLVVTLDHPATDAGRPELTARGDAAFARDAAEFGTDVGVLAAQTEVMATSGRSAMDRLRSQDTVGARGALADGDTAFSLATIALSDLTATRASLGTDLGSLPLGIATTHRLTTIDAAISAASAKLADAWKSVGAGSVPGIAVIESLGRHDALAFRATTSARSADYDTALATLNDAASELAGARSLRDKLAAQGDASTLSDWIDRAAAYDAALTRLYSLLLASNGVMTTDATHALAAVTAAQAALPADTSALVVIVAEIGQQGYTEGLLGIEAVRGAVGSAVTALGPSPSLDGPASP